MSSFVERITELEDRLFDRLRSPATLDAASDDPTGDLDSFRGRRYCLLVTYRRNGTPVPSPVWFALDREHGRLYVHTGGWKVKRIAKDPHVRVAPCTFRGRPLGPPLDAIARLLPPTERAHGEAVLATSHTLVQRLYYATLGRSQHALAEIVEIMPTATSTG